MGMENRRVQAARVQAKVWGGCRGAVKGGDAGGARSVQVGAVQVGAGGLRQEAWCRECCDDGDVGNPCWHGFGFSTSWAVVYSCSVYLKVANIAIC